jgi:hypothetical protein
MDAKSIPLSCEEFACSYFSKYLLITQLQAHFIL